jgi:plasmid stability protein
VRGRGPATFAAVYHDGRGSAYADLPEHHAIQFSIFSPPTCRKCFSLLVTRVNPHAHAWAAVIASRSPIGLPLAMSLFETLPNHAAHSESNGTTSTPLVNLSPRRSSELEERTNSSTSAEHRAILRDALLGRRRARSFKRALASMPEVGVDEDFVFERDRDRPDGLPG